MSRVDYGLRKEIRIAKLLGWRWYISKKHVSKTWIVDFTTPEFLAPWHVEVTTGGIIELIPYAGTEEEAIQVIEARSRVDCDPFYRVPRTLDKDTLDAILTYAKERQWEITLWPTTGSTDLKHCWNCSIRVVEFNVVIRSAPQWAEALGDAFLAANDAMPTNTKDAL